MAFPASIFFFRGRTLCVRCSLFFGAACCPCLVLVSGKDVWENEGCRNVFEVLPLYGHRPTEDSGKSEISSILYSALRCISLAGALWRKRRHGFEVDFYLVDIQDVLFILNRADFSQVINIFFSREKFSFLLRAISFCLVKGRRGASHCRKMQRNGKDSEGEGYRQVNRGNSPIPPYANRLQGFPVTEKTLQPVDVTVLPLPVAGEVNGF